MGTFLEMVKFPHTVFALPFAAAGMLLPERGLPRWEVVAWVLAAMVGARTAAMGFNRLADVRFDAGNRRTADRALPAGTLSRGFTAFAVILAAGLFLFAAHRLNPLCFRLAFPTLVVLLGYSLTKRFTSLCHFALGTALGIAPMGGYLAVTGAFDAGFPAALVLGVAVLLWVAGFDILYACQDVEADRAQGLHSLPASLGVAGALRGARFLHAGTVAALAAFAVAAGLGGFFLLALLAVTGFLVAEHRLVSPGDLGKVNVAFFHLNATIALLVLAGVVADLLLPGALGIRFRA